MFLLVGEDPFRARLRLAELARALVSGGPTGPGDLSAVASPDLRGLVGVTRHDARQESTDVIAMSGRSQGLFDDPDERRVVVVEQAEAITDPSFVAAFPAETGLVLSTTERIAGRGRRSRGAAVKGAPAERIDLAGAVIDAGGRVERISRLLPDHVPGWITARSRLTGTRLEPTAVHELASAVGTDTDRIDQELRKLATYSRGEPVTVADVRALVAGAIETEVFDLTRAVVRRDARAATATLERLLAEGQAPQQILALLLWQFRVLLFAARMNDMGDAEKAAKAIRSSAGAIARWRGEARRVSRADVTRAYEALYATDLAIKQGRTDPETAMMLCVLDLCGVAGADPRDLIVGEPPKR
ncbi:MAG: DNA polymerase III subunit delta [Candidatus Limnocylindria bacterium]